MWWRLLAPLLASCLLASAAAKDAPPKVQVYSRAPREYGKTNTLICHVNGFHPPEIAVELLKNGNKIPHSHLTDLAFEHNWKYHLTSHVTFTPTKEDKYSCRVTHLKKTNTHIWEPEM